MTEDKFQKVLDYLQLDPTDRRSLALRCLFVAGMTRAETGRAIGMSQPNVSALADRTLRELRRAGNLTGVYIEPVIRRGVPGRKAKP